MDLDAWKAYCSIILQHVFMWFKKCMLFLIGCI
jgi:hypothetical protein